MKGNHGGKWTSSSCSRRPCGLAIVPSTLSRVCLPQLNESDKTLMLSLWLRHWMVYKPYLKRQKKTPSTTNRYWTLVNNTHAAISGEKGPDASSLLWHLESIKMNWWPEGQRTARRANTHSQCYDTIWREGVSTHYKAVPIWIAAKCLSKQT